MSGEQQVYGLHAVTSVLEQRPGSVRQLYLQAGRGDSRLARVRELAVAAGIGVRECAREELDRLTAERHQGAIAVVSELPVWRESDLPALLTEAGRGALLLVLDGVTDPHNLGACLRSADAAGAHAVIAPRDKSAGLTPTVRKVACGAAETVPFVSVTNLARCLRRLQDQGLWLVGLAGEAEAELYDVDLTGPIALVLGAEGSGLRRLTRESCDYLARLPMAGSVDSLNVSVATGICLFEAVRQRQGREPRAGSRGVQSRGPGAGSRGKS